MRKLAFSAVLALFLCLKAWAIEPAQWNVSVFGTSVYPTGTAETFKGACEDWFNKMAPWRNRSDATWSRITRMDTAPPWRCELQIGNDRMLLATFGANGVELVYYQGALDWANCNGITGWAWNAHRPTTPMTVTLLADGKDLMLVTADVFRQDLLNANKGDGKHGFYVPLPPALTDGQRHWVQAKIGEKWLDYGQSGFTFTCASAARIELEGLSRTRAMPAGPALMQTATVTRGGAPLAGAAVSVSIVGASPVNGVTDSQGRFTFKYTPPLWTPTQAGVTATCTGCGNQASKVIQVDACTTCEAPR